MGTTTSTSTISTASTTIRYVHTDQIGGSNIITDGAGAIVETLDFYSYGQARIDTKAASYGGEKRKFASSEADAISGLNYMMARYESPTKGSFISEDLVFLEDPKKQNLEDPQSLNSYSYANNNPITKIDPTGNSAMSSFFSYNGNAALNPYKLEAYYGLKNFAETQVYGRAAIGALAIGGVAAVETGALPYLVQGAGGVAVRAYNDKQDDGKINDPAWKYVTSASISTVAGRILEGTTIIPTVLGTAGASLIEDRFTNQQFTSDSFKNLFSAVGGRTASFYSIPESLSSNIGKLGFSTLSTSLETSVNILLQTALKFIR
jgi:RHS repeat-associated protein